MKPRTQVNWTRSAVFKKMDLCWFNYSRLNDVQHLIFNWYRILKNISSMTALWNPMEQADWVPDSTVCSRHTWFTGNSAKTKLTNSDLSIMRMKNSPWKLFCFWLDQLLSWINCSAGSIAQLTQLLRLLIFVDRLLVFGSIFFVVVLLKSESSQQTKFKKVEKNFPSSSNYCSQFSVYKIHEMVNLVLNSRWV